MGKRLEHTSIVFSWEKAADFCACFNCLEFFLWWRESKFILLYFICFSSPKQLYVWLQIWNDRCCAFKRWRPLSSHMTRERRYEFYSSSWLNYCSRTSLKEWKTNRWKSLKRKQSWFITPCVYNCVVLWLFFLLRDDDGNSRTNFDRIRTLGSSWIGHDELVVFYAGGLCFARSKCSWNHVGQVTRCKMSVLLRC